jgi:GntR family transcriptional regulator of vanillate catabolism
MTTLHERVLMQLRDLVLRGDFAPGARLAEQQLAERLNTSRTPVRAALVSLEQEGLVEANDTVGYVVRQFTAQEVADAIAVRGHLEGMAARLVAEHGLSRQLARDLKSCLDEGDAALAPAELMVEEYAAYAAMNDRFHSLILEACGNRALQRAVAMNDKLPFAPASAMLPMQGTLALDRDWMLYAHRQHHMLFGALERGEGARAQALAMEHTEVAQYNLRQALERRNESERVMPAMRLVVGR